MEMKKHETGRKVIGAKFYVPISIFTATTRALWEYMNIHGDTMLYRANEQCGSVGCLFHSVVSLVLTGSFCLLRNATKVFDLLITDSFLQLFSLSFIVLIM